MACRGVTGGQRLASGQPALSRSCDPHGLPDECGGAADAGGRDGDSERVAGRDDDVCEVLRHGAEKGDISRSCSARTARR